jgi:hypothetical protein
MVSRARRRPWRSGREADAPGRCHAGRHLPLRSREGRGTEATSVAHRLQLLHLPSLRHALGLLQGIRRQRHCGARRHGRLCVGTQVASLRQVRALRLRHTLGTDQVKSGSENGRQRKKLRAVRAWSGPRSPSRWSRHMEVPLLACASAEAGSRASMRRGLARCRLIVHDR